MTSRAHAQHDPMIPLRESPDDVLAAQDHPSLMATLALLRHRRWILGIGLATAAIVTVFTLTRPARYVSLSSFVARSSSGRSQLAGLAAQFGITAPSVDATSSPEFFAALSTASSILEAVSRDSVTLSTGRTAVIPALGIATADTLLRRDAALRRLRLMISPSVEPRIGVVRLAVSAADPLLAKGLNERVLFHVERFYRESRQSQAAAERSSAENLLDESGAELRNAESRLRSFEESNRNYDMSPQLRLTHERLARDIAMRQQVYTTLLQARETARLDESRSVPVISIVDDPSTPVRPARRMILFKAVGAFLLGVIIASVIAIIRQNSPFRTARREEQEELRALTREALAELRAPWRMFRLGGG